MKKYLFTLFITLLVFGLNANAGGAYKEIDTDGLLKLKKENKNLTIIDARGADAFDGIAVEGAKQLSVRDTDEKSLAAINPDKSAPIVFYCGDYRCVSSSKSVIIAEHAGYTNIYKYVGGIADWKQRGLPTENLPKKQ